MTTYKHTDPVSKKTIVYDGVKTGTGVLFHGEVGDVNMTPIERQKWAGNGHLQETFGEVAEPECVIVEKPRTTWNSVARALLSLTFLFFPQVP